jgi:hypothetical protein
MDEGVLLKLRGKVRRNVGVAIFILTRLKRAKRVLC